jgi:anti-sigma factor RsiW
MDKQKTRELLDRYVAGELDNEATAELRLTLGQSPELRREETSARLVEELLPQTVLEQPPAGFEEQVLAQVSQEPRRKLVMAHEKPRSIGLITVLVGLGLSLVLSFVLMAPQLFPEAGVNLNLDPSQIPMFVWVLAAQAFAIFAVVRSLIHFRRDKAFRTSGSRSR